MQHIMPHYSPTMWDHTLNAEKWLLHPMFHRQQPTSCFKKTSDAPWWFIASSQSSDGLSLAHLITHIDLFEGWALQAMPNSKQSATTWNFECKKLNHTHTHSDACHSSHPSSTSLNPRQRMCENTCSLFLCGKAGVHHGSSHTHTQTHMQLQMHACHSPPLLSGFSFFAPKMHQDAVSQHVVA